MKKGWETKRLSDFSATVSTGPFGSVLHKSDYVDVGVPLVNPINMVDEGIIPDPSKLIGEVTKLRLSCYVLKAGDVVVARRGEIGRCAVIGANEDGWVCGTGSFFIRPLPKLDSQFLAHLIRSNGYREKLEQLSTGTTMKNLSNTALGDLSISVPPLPEQQRIVGVLNEAFAGLATAQANAEKNLQNARELFESHLQSVFTQRDAGWAEKRLGDVAEFKNGLNFSRQSNGQTLRMVGVGDFHDNTVVPTESLQSVTIDGEISDDYLIRRDDILTVRSNGSKDLVGRCMLVPDVDGMTSYSGFIIRIRFDTREINPRFMLRFLKSSKTRERLTRDGGGANISNINQAKLSDLPIFLPSFQQQEEIAERIEVFATKAKRLETIYQKKLAALTALKKSLLHQAFTGAL